jgi:glyoxylase-like metal-dependent hydrolase (beta-lactamase superfamily II)/rhodanese-related sulfurtransferase
MVGSPEITPEEFERRLLEQPGTVVLDVRSREEFDDWRVEAPEAVIVNVPEAEIDPSNGTLDGIDESTTINVLCAAGNASGRVTARLREAGRDAVNVAGGMIAWSRLLTCDEIPIDGPFTVLQFRRESRGCLSYLIGHDGEALVVDPAPDPAPYVKEAETRGWKIVAVFDTHVHADHVSGMEELVAASGERALMPKRSVERGLDRPSVELLDDGDSIEIGGEALEVISLPGHTTEMTGLVAGNSLLTGDSLFADSIARPDLQHPEPKAARAAANDLYLTLSSKILSRPDETIILPGHYPGGRLSGPVMPTLAEVRTTVSELSLGAEPFVDWMVGDLPPKPANHDTIIGLNLGLRQVPEDDIGRLETGGNSCAVG